MKTSPEDYKPQPLDISGVVLSDELLDLTEQLAENVHDVWAESRMKQGWTYGKERNDAAKQHPCLVPYADLSEQEKQYDRDTAMNTIKMIVKAGFVIKKA
ncbi:MAG: Ryanodine receptor Ryr [Bacteroidales bacterium]|nr:Ryanodine receptor Ryr [Bacteroidales bacterium]